MQHRPDRINPFIQVGPTEIREPMSVRSPPEPDCRISATEPCPFGYRHNFVLDAERLSDFDLG